ncbi:long-chain fatty acid transport protein 6 [Takifugu rubripes]|uniref:long-chain fatty acid transport protein 6 n=1 Tax=Takifugu rubripes TaxID=31033 RepID=UPI0011452DD2|nr:long-chain fatty acid transport protein 6 [Takifugu rubripes]
MSLCLGLVSALCAGLLFALALQKLRFPYFWRDLFFLFRVVRYGVKLELFRFTSSVCTVLDRFVQQAQRIPDKPFVVYDGRVHTYQDVDRRSNRLANVFHHTAKLKKGDCVAVLMSNEPDFLCVWFGLAKAGCSVAFLNTNIKSKSLLHCFTCCGATTLIVGSDLVESLDGILSTLLEDKIQVWTMRSQWRNSQVHTLLDKLDAASDQPVPAELRACTSLKTPTLYIFTSGTTGLPKAAVISQLQSLKAAAGFWAFGGTEEDVVYIPLPLYHSAASLVGIGGTIQLGATCVLKKKFSASKFWSDCREQGVTIFQYIGELCRYLCNQPKNDLDRDHKVRMGVGNGLRPDVWREFHNRFGKVRMCEVYGSTEGNLCFMNHIGKIGTVGRSNALYKLLFKYDLVKYDMMKDLPAKDQRGFCQRVDKGETGLLLSKVSSISPFFGYAGSKSLTEKKLMRDVFAKGDVYFNTGDLMVEDQHGFICFRDRVGDTYRWKGENVATTEVAESLGLVDFIQEVNVYGVEVPGQEGRAGMAAVITRPGATFDGKKLFEHAMRDLPAYARPLFIRLQEEMEMTSTFKQQKFQLVQSGFNPSRVLDPLYVLDSQQQNYVPLTDSVYQNILSGEHRL